MIDRLTHSLSTVRQRILKAQHEPNNTTTLTKLYTDHNKMQRIILQLQQQLDHILTTTHLGFFPCDYTNTCPIYLKPEVLEQDVVDIYPKAEIAQQYNLKNKSQSLTTAALPTSSAKLTTATSTTSTSSLVQQHIPHELNVVTEDYIKQSYYIPQSKEEKQYLTTINNLALTLPPGTIPPNLVKFHRNNTLTLAATVGDNFKPMNSDEEVRYYIQHFKYVTSLQPTPGTKHSPAQQQQYQQYIDAHPVDLYTLQSALHYLITTMKFDETNSDQQQQQMMTPPETLTLLQAFTQHATRLLTQLTRHNNNSAAGNALNHPALLGASQPDAHTGPVEIEIKRGMAQLSSLSGGGASGGPMLKKKKKDVGTK